MAKRHDYGSATAKQFRFIGALAATIAGCEQNDHSAIAKVLIANGAPQNEHTGGLAIQSLSKFQASLLIARLIRIRNEADSFAGTRANHGYDVDPGELAADRWAETQVGL